MDQFTLSRGGHETREKGVCIMEAVAWFAGEAHSDAPQCACFVIASFARALNDLLNDEERQRLKPLIPALAMSRAGWPITLKRTFIAADWAVRVFAPIEVEARGRRADAARLRKLYPIVDRESARRSSAAAIAADGCAPGDAAGAADAAACAAGHMAAATDAAAHAAKTAAAAAAHAAAAAAYTSYDTADACMDSRRLADLGIACLERMLAI
jgi:hypothetical protein